MPALLLAGGMSFEQRTSVDDGTGRRITAPAFSGIIIASRFNVYTRTGTRQLAASVLGFVVTVTLVDLCQPTGSYTNRVIDFT